MPLYKGDKMAVWRPVEQSEDKKPVKGDYEKMEEHLDCRFHEIPSPRRVEMQLSLKGDHRELFVHLSVIETLLVDYIVVDEAENSIWKIINPVLKVMHPKGHWQATLSVMGIGPESVRIYHGI